MEALALRRLLVLSAIAAVSALAHAQATAPTSAPTLPPDVLQGPASSAPPPALIRRGSAQDHSPTLSAGTQLVVVDVTVTDAAGKPIHGLKPTDFLLDENKKPQTIKSFDEHSGSAAAITKLPPPLKLPPGMFSDYTPVPTDSPLSILLLDTLNTPMVDQSYVRYQLKEYLKKADPNVRIAIFGLSSKLYLLQGFTADPEVLRNVVDHKLLPRSSVLLDDPVGTGATSESISDQLASIGATNSAVSSMAQFEAQEQSFQTQLRIQYTLDAFNALARYLADFPGRKNLIWFSGSFPLTIFADPSLSNPFLVQNSAGDEVRETANLLNRARVAVYPVDARGLQTLPSFSAANGGHNYAKNPARLGQETQKFTQNNAEEHMTMDEIADDTGGRAFYNNNDLTAAVRRALDAGSNFYTLTYTPGDRNWNGDYRNIRVQMNGASLAQGYKLAYRSGYYANDPANPASSVVASNNALSTANATQRFDQTAMQRGAPEPSEILMKVRVLPASAETETAVLPTNTVDPKKPMKGPFRNYVVDFAALAQNIHWTVVNGVHQGAVEVMSFVYDTDGNLLNTQGDTVKMSLSVETYAKLLKEGLKFRQEISAPAKGDSFLRLGIHDLSNDHFGVLEVPTAEVARLPPLPSPVAPPPVATGTPPATVPATPTSTPPVAAPTPPSTPGKP